jgi:anti-sigma regulatory factor (Ser/Thr protein kinase)
MARTPRQAEEIRGFIVENVERHPSDIGRLVALQFRCSRVTAVAHLARLSEEGIIEVAGRTKGRRYSLKEERRLFRFDVSPGLEEDVVWRENLLPELKNLPENVLNICDYGLTEMVNNVVDHSESAVILIALTRSVLRTRIQVIDTGVGIFNKIQQKFNLHDPRHALLELAKGKLTTDQERHTGEGVFFASRVFDEFRIVSGRLYYQRTNQTDDEWLIDAGDSPLMDGTAVDMQIRNDASRTLREVFDSYVAGEGDFSFARTHVPIRLAMYEGEQMLSRSQAKRILARVDQFREVILDFRGVTGIGQAFADEIFRVFAAEHPEVHILPLFTTDEIDKMIARAKSGEIASEPQQLSLLSLGGAQG